MSDALLSQIRPALADIERFSRVQAPRFQLRRYQLPAARAIAQAVAERRGIELAAVFARQSGKDEMLAQLCAWMLWRYQRVGGNVVVAVPALKPQGHIARDRLLARLEGPLTQGRYQVRDGTIVQLGRASVRYLSASPLAHARGNTADLLLVANEAQGISPDIWDAVFAPMGAASNAPTLFMGTIWTSTTLLSRQLRLLAEQERADGQTRRFLVPWREVAAELPRYGDFVRRQIDQHGEHHPFIRTEYELQELDDDSSLFPALRRETLRGDFPPCLRPPGADRAGIDYALTIDVAGQEESGIEGAALRQLAPRRDSTVATVVRVIHPPSHAAGLPTYEVVARYEWTGTRHNRLHDEIVALATRVWRARRIVIDATGVGAGLASFLAASLGERVVTPFVFSTASKSKLGWDLLSLIDAGRIQVCTPIGESDPEQHRLDRQFWAQLSACRFTVLPGPGRLMRWSVEDERLHDDLLMSFALIAVLDRDDWRSRLARGSSTSESFQRPW